ncbi:hypothetical protein K402DRAFT_467657 [Aulographum hederae CBS 113979]|uniref:SCP domain-containing protein n=1 Tax=Aulographum hederae CBS 113979 TaxID=1176131 RepID=A0A6G1GK46_9PEZI|nr:hypothetical protein K402DRAFT_467657 [Aulographum hederae CBS 113979]
MAFMAGSSLAALGGAMVTGPPTGNLYGAVSHDFPIVGLNLTTAEIQVVHVCKSAAHCAEVYGSAHHNHGHHGHHASVKPRSENDGPFWSDGVSVLDTMNKWRDIYGLPHFTWSSHLATNAMFTTWNLQPHRDHPDFKHDLHDSWGQVAAPAANNLKECNRDAHGYTTFEAYFLSFLCESPNDRQLNGMCPTVQSITSNFGSDTGHHDLLLYEEITQIGCYFGQWEDGSACDHWTGWLVCDLAPGWYEY